MVAMKNSDFNQQSLIAAMELLLAVIESPAVFKDNEKLKKSLKSQGSFAKYEDTERGIKPCSLNTQKTCADRIISGGFEQLNQRRLNAILAIERKIEGANKANRQTRTGLLRKVNELELDVAILEKQNVMLITLVSNLTSSLSRFAEISENSKLMTEFEGKNKEIQAMLNYTTDGIVE